MLQESSQWIVDGSGKIAGSGDLRIESDENTLDEIKNRIDEHKRILAVTSAEQHELKKGIWELAPSGLEQSNLFDFFRRNFGKNELLRDLFARQP